MWKYIVHNSITIIVVGELASARTTFVTVGCGTKPYQGDQKFNDNKLTSLFSKCIIEKPKDLWVSYRNSSQVLITVDKIKSTAP